ncbi:transporter, NhaC family [Methanobrevibacter gottschalkii]|uniref:Transporter (NhaC family) n=2 Tax=Methanobrevibacter gottschalkii TaxID=190974 RepID=A0A3N5B125_9EURY|nr:MULTISPECIES: Na+/H+ antiporter NhaC family protein [Methanobrevibacter]MCQ2970569.1 Na+/H+ antiporter NhaC family protein [archaeon]OED01691.1 sodium:proton antiporter [Methanobrevibacter sp. A27]RPF50967.1 transporter (NhaC family) [Methanobrevibacter gottschalkii DSM 11977]SEL08141.1 transporter, NhaC family [Methanobrevibacter gottschalkii]
MNINNNMKLGLIAAISIIALFVLSLWISQTPANDDNSIRFGILTLLPPLVAIGLAFITKETILSLFMGVFVGEFMLCVNDLNIVSTAINAFLQMGSQIISCMADPWNAGIILQCLLIGGIIQLVTKMGGAKALADTFARRADTPRKAQLFTWFLGLCVFFDDYANSLIVGPIMRPVMDKLKVSREKLAFIVDATAAPVAGIAIISTWIGLEISLIAAGFESVGVTNVTGFGIFLQTIPYRFYNIFILLFIVISSITLYEFGPMKKAEQTARKRKENEEIIVPNAPGFDEVKPVEGIKLSIWNAIIPIGTLIIGALIAFYWSGYTTILGGEDQALIAIMKSSPLSFNGVFTALSQSDASVALFQAALLASIVAIVMAVGERILTIEDAISEWIGGMKTIVITGVILLLAWSLGGVIGDVGTANYLVGVLKNTLPQFIVPALIFILGALISFATGTAYGTMSILMPLAIPLAWAVGSGDMSFTIVCTSGVLTGAIFGDHCSPISDTTILSSMGTSCNHIDHVQTQIYYAIFVASVAIFIGYIPAGLGIPWFISIPIGVVVMYVGLKILGQKVDFDEVEESSS